MLVLDLFCGEGGAAAGYAKAGFQVIGIDDDAGALACYPYECHLMDWRDGLEKFGSQAALIHASPPCQRYSVLTPAWARESHPDLIPEVQDALDERETPWVIENVPGAPLLDPVTLCGCMFGLTAELEGQAFALYRKRLFEAGRWAFPEPPHESHGIPSLPVVHNPPRSFRRDHGNLPVTHDDMRKAMRCGWMTGHGVTQAIPPAFTEYIGKCFRDS